MYMSTYIHVCCKLEINSLSLSFKFIKNICGRTFLWGIYTSLVKHGLFLFLVKRELARRGGGGVGV